MSKIDTQAVVGDIPKGEILHSHFFPHSKRFLGILVFSNFVSDVIVTMFTSLKTHENAL